MSAAARTAVGYIESGAVTPMIPTSEAEARTRKVVALVVLLREVGATPGIVRAFTPHARQLAERAAHVKPASDETWRQVADCLASTP